MSESADVALTAVKSIIIITSTIGNSLVCAVMMRNRDMRIPINYLLVNLAVADMMYLGFYTPKIILSLAPSAHPEGVTGRILCTLLTDGNVSRVGAISSIITLVAVATERYYAVVYPLGNKGKLTIRKLKVIIPCIWISSLILDIPDFLNEEFDKKKRDCIHVWSDGEKWIPKVEIMMWLLIVPLAFVLLVGLYSRVVYTLWVKPNNDNELTHQQRGVLKVRKRVTLMVVIVSAIFGICWGTDATLHALEDYGSYNISPVAIPIAHTMLMFNSAVNPFAYALINQRFREKIKAMMCCRSRVIAPMGHPARASQDTELANNAITQPTDTRGRSSIE